MVYRDAMPPFTFKAFFTAFPPPCLLTFVCLPLAAAGILKDAFWFVSPERD